MKGLAKEHICITDRHRQQYGDDQKEEGMEAGWRWAKWKKNGVICNSVKN